jgi:hypothetical protein
MYLRQSEVCDLHSWLAEHVEKKHPFDPFEEPPSVEVRKEEDEEHEIVLGNCVLCGEEFILSVDGCGRIEDYTGIKVRDRT